MPLTAKESDGTPGLYVDFLFTSQIWAFSQEVRLTSNYDGPFNWIVGANYGRDEVAERPGRIGYLGDYLAPLGSPIDTINLTYEQDRENIAGYGQVTFDVSEKLRVSAGARVLRDDLKFRQKVDIFAKGGVYLFGNQLPQSFVNPDGSVTELDGLLDDTAVTWRVAVDFIRNDDILVYGSVATGYKPGGFNAGFNFNPRQYLPFYEEEVTAFEIGLKSTLANGRAVFNAAAFTYDYDGLQATTVRVFNEVPFTSLDNLAQVDVDGFEVDLHLRPVESLDIKLGFSVLDTKNNDPRPNLDGPTGDSPRKLANAPKQTFNAAVTYMIPLANGGTLRLFGDYYYQGDHFREIVNIVPLEISQDQLNARITYVSPNGNWDIGAWAKNITDEVWVTDTLNGPADLGWGVWVYGPPRSFGVTANWRWGQ